MNVMVKLYKKYKEIINYVIVGGMTTFVSLASYYFCVIIILNPNDAYQLQIANIVSWICSVTFAYFANRKYVFESKNKNRISEAMMFYVSILSTLLLDMVTMFILVTILSYNDKFAKLLVQVIVLITNYILSKFLVFKKKE